MGLEPTNLDVGNVALYQLSYICIGGEGGI